MIVTCTVQAHFGNDAYHAAMFRSKTSVILLTEHVKWMDVYLKMMSCELLYVTNCAMFVVFMWKKAVFSVILNHPLVKASTACSELILEAMKEVANGTEECFFNQLQDIV